MQQTSCLYNIIDFINQLKANKFYGVNDPLNNVLLN
jgi:hypothetical protein